MAHRAEFLDSIKHRTRSGKYKPTVAPDAAWTRTPDRPFQADYIQDPPARFLQEWKELGGHGERVKNLTEAKQYILDLAKDREAKKLVRWDVPELDKLDVDKSLAQAGVEVSVWRDLEDFREVASAADIGLSTSEWAIAETGSLVLESGPGKGRTVTLLPPTYVALVPVEKILRTLSEAIQKYADGNLPANVCFHTGPSRSGDIEMSLAIGVHGPGDVHVLVVG